MKHSHFFRKKSYLISTVIKFTNHYDLIKLPCVTIIVNFFNKITALDKCVFHLLLLKNKTQWGIIFLNIINIL